jgi:tetratricopeptide (TPR) repeat protein
MKTKRLLVPTLFSVLIFASGCAAFQASSDVAAGRNALQTGRPSDAIISLTRAAEVDPNYRIPYQLPVSVWTYLGRAYYETGRDAEARNALEKALSLDPNDFLAQLYLGLAQLRSGDRERGRRTIEGSLKGLHETIEFIAADNVHGQFWDPGRSIRTDIEKTLAGKLTDSEFASAAAQIGKDFDNEIDRARRDEALSRGGGGGGGGGD